ncbi:MAG TPA: TRAP transporter substrate-binding protein [Burkholderiales bacterium]|nr:TRAP transporter substrate-binding protein [Burkholderiales bacterium]
MRRTIIAIAALAIFGTASAQTKWNMPTPYPDGNFHTKNVREFAEQVAKASGGKLQIQVHSNGSLIKHPEIKRAVQTGQIPIGEVLISVLSNESPLFAFDSNPFLANSYAKEKKLWDAARPHIVKRLDSQGIELLYSVPWPPQGLYTKKEINSLDDLKGTKFRTYSPTTSRFAELVGAVPTTIQVPDIPQAFRTGLVDAMITSGATGVDSQAWDYLQYYYDTQAFLPQNMVIVNKSALGKLDSASRRALLDAAKAAEPRGWKTSESENEGYVKTMASHGIKIMKPSSKLSSEFEAIGHQMAEEWAKKAGDEGAAILKAYRK